MGTAKHMWTTYGFQWKMIYSHGGFSASFLMFTGGYFPAMARHGHGQQQKKAMEWATQFSDKPEMSFDNSCWIAV
jgi:hypothetical protein